MIKATSTITTRRRAEIREALTGHPDYPKLNAALLGAIEKFIIKYSYSRTSIRELIFEWMMLQSSLVGNIDDELMATEKKPLIVLLFECILTEEHARIATETYLPLTRFGDAVVNESPVTTHRFWTLIGHVLNWLNARAQNRSIG